MKIFKKKETVAKSEYDLLVSMNNDNLDMIAYLEKKNTNLEGRLDDANRKIWELGHEINVLKKKIK